MPESRGGTALVTSPRSMNDRIDELQSRIRETTNTGLARWYAGRIDELIEQSRVVCPRPELCRGEHDGPDDACVFELTAVPVINPGDDAEPLVLLEVHRDAAGAWLEIDVDGHSAQVRLPDLDDALAVVRAQVAQSGDAPWTNVSDARAYFAPETPNRAECQPGAGTVLPTVDRPATGRTDSPDADRS